jgi:hypothetical protein
VYQPELARPTSRLADLARLRGVHALFGVFLVNQLGIADQTERLLALESLLELPRSIGPAIRVPLPDRLPPGPLATERLDPQLLKLGLATADELVLRAPEERPDYGDVFVPPLTLADKLLRLFQHDFPGVHDVRIRPVWVAGEVLEFGDFDRYITSYKLQKQEGLILRHLLRLVLLIDEFAELTPPETTLAAWRDSWGEVADRLEHLCREVDPASTEQWLDEAQAIRDSLS